jgi:uncharacterized protein
VTQVTTYAPGTPCWVDVTSPDLDRSIEFYRGLFGWDAFRVPDPDAGGYTMFRVGDADVAAASAPRGEAPSAWSTYIASDDVDATAATVREHGGTLVLEPFDVMDAGRMALVQDPTGGVFGVWQAGKHHGAGLVNEPGSFIWNELNTHNVEAAQAFYSTVFGWEPEPLDDEPGFVYQVQKLGGRAIGGILQMTEQWRDVPPNWMAYFAVEDTDATVEKAKELGAGVSVEPFDSAYGRIAVLRDPTGAVFSVMAAA